MLLCSSAMADDSYVGRWDTLWNAHSRLTATPNGAIYERRLIAAHNLFWRDITRRCSAEAVEAGMARFRGVAVVNKEGVVTEFVLMPNDASLQCFSKEMVGRKYPKPPKSIFYQAFVVNLDG